MASETGIPNLTLNLTKASIAFENDKLFTNIDSNNKFRLGCWS